MASHYKLQFRGAVHSDQHPAIVRPRLQAMLKASDAQMDVMFSGKPVTIKKAVDEATAERYLDAFVKAGAKLELVEVAAPVEKPAASAPEAESPQAQPVTANDQPGSAENPAEQSAFQLAEVGADLAPSSDRTDSAPVNVSTDHLTLATPGTILGGERTDAALESPSVDTSHLQLDQPGVRLGTPAPEVSEADLLLDFDFELGEVGEVLVESSPAVVPELPDLSHLQLESPPTPEPEELA